MDRRRSIEGVKDGGDVKGGWKVGTNAQWTKRPKNITKCSVLYI